jgi:hypothetical protein
MMKPLVLLAFVSFLVLTSATPASAQKPGSPYPGFFAPGPQTIIEPSTDGPPGTADPIVIHPIGSIVYPGYLILVDTRGNPSDPKTWSDVVAFDVNPSKPGCGGFETANTAVLVSSAVGETGISDADLAQIPAAYSARVTVAEITGMFGSGCVAIVAEDPTSGLSTYDAGGVIYHIYSAPDLATPATRPSWGQLKLIYR